jgi:amino acid adenylation domain-containing protein/non-ribosomal peptide synthase protein (TIGR01720 family)
MEWNSQQLEPVDSVVHEMFKQRVLENGAAKAVCAWDVEFTYAELDQLSTQLASYMVKSLGVGPGVFVPDCFDKSGWTVVAMLAVIKAGGVHVAIDATHPRERHRIILEDTKAHVVLVAAQHVSLFDGVQHVVVVQRSLFDELPPASDDDLKHIEVKPNDPLLVVYTSGSTGTPKGILMEHRSLASSVSAWGAPQYMRNGPESRVLSFSSHAFDVSKADVFGTLMFGGCICIMSEQERLNDLSGAINRLGANSAWLTPSVASLLRPSDVPGMKFLTLCGEQIKQENIDAWADKVRLINGYGPAECTVNSTCLVVDSDTAVGNIGRGVGTHIWIVENGNHDKLCSIGAIGELLIEGPLVARGYINNKEKTDAVFIVNPKWADPADAGRRFYKSGDLGCYNSDGTITYVGRSDSQVKIHGQRTELSEIEHHLLMAPGIDKAVVLFPKSGPCANRLVAIASITGFSSTTEHTSGVPLLSNAQKDQASPNLQKIREYLKSKVPPFMLPAVWVPVTRIPLSTNMKVDRLTAMRMLESMSEDVYHDVVDNRNSTNGPTNAIEKRLQSVLSRILNISLNEIGMDNSFMSLGGDSITAMQLTAACRSEGLLINVKDIMLSKTIAGIASCAKSTGREIATPHEEKMDTPFQISPIQQLYFDTQSSSQESQQGAHFNQSFLLRLMKEVNVQELIQALATVVSHHPMLGARFKYEEARWTQLVSSDARKSSYFKQHTISSRQEMLSIIQDAQSALDIKNGPVFSAHIFDLGTDERMLFLVAHHLVIDLVSWRVILQDLEDLLSGRELPVQESISFRAWCQLQEQNVQNEPVDSDILPRHLHSFYEFWGMADRPNTFEDAVEKRISMDEDITAAVFGRSNDGLRTEPVEIILAAISHSFSATFTERHLPTIFSEGHGREPWDTEIDLSRTVGWFTTMSPLALSLEKNEMKPIPLLRYIKDSRRRIAGNSRRYFSAQFLGSETNGSNPFHEMEIVFNYLGRFSQLEREDAFFQLEHLKDGETIQNAGGNVRRFGLIEINAVMLNKKLELSFAYNKYIKHEEKLQSWIDRCRESFKQLVDELETISLQFTLSDFPLLPLTSHRLTLLEEKFRNLKLQPSNIEDAYPCSPIQEGILISQASDSEVYRIAITCEVLPKQKAVDVNALRSAWQQVVDRHPVLRTVFVDSVCETALYDQVVLKTTNANICVKQCEDPLREFQEQRPMSVDSASSMHRLQIFASESGSGVFMKLEINHTLIDGSSLPVLFRDLTLAYEGKLPGGSGPLYSDYIAYLQTETSNSSIEYWKTYLADAEPCYFPVSRPKKEDISPNRLETVAIEIAQVKELHEYCVKNNVTMANVFQTAWAVVLRAYTRSDKVNFGFLSSGRDIDIRGITDAIGPFINMLVCHLDLGSEVTALQAIEKMQSDFLSSLPHQHCSLAEVQHALNAGGQPMFNSALSLQRPLSGDSSLESEISFRDTGSYDPSEYDISLNIAASSKTIDVSLSFWTSKTSTEEARNIAATFATAVSSLLKNPESRLHELDLFSPRDKEQVWAWNNNGQTPPAMEACIHDKFEQRALSQPDAPALCSWDGELTYSQLSEITTRLAQRLIDLGVVTEDAVVTCFDKSMWTIVAMIAIWKAGGVCVAHDPSHPQDRLRGKISATKAKLLLCGQSHEVMMHAMHPNVVVVGDLLYDQLPPLSGTSIGKRATPNNAAFIYFTSGSTGEPKGIVAEHRGYCTMADTWTKEMGFDRHTRAFQFAVSSNHCLSP